MRNMPLLETVVNCDKRFTMTLNCGVLILNNLQKGKCKVKIHIYLA